MPNWNWWHVPIAHSGSSTESCALHNVCTKSGMHSHVQPPEPALAGKQTISLGMQGPGHQGQPAPFPSPYTLLAASRPHTSCRSGVTTAPWPRVLGRRGAWGLLTGAHGRDAAHIPVGNRAVLVLHALAVHRVHSQALLDRILDDGLAHDGSWRRCKREVACITRAANGSVLGPVPVAMGRRGSRPTCSEHLLVRINPWSTLSCSTRRAGGRGVQAGGR